MPEYGSPMSTPLSTKRPPGTGRRNGQTGRLPSAWRGLAGDGDVFLHAHRRDEADVTAHVEHHRPAGGAHGVAERSRAAVVEIGDVNHRSAASARDVRAVTQRAGKSRDLGESRRNKRGDEKAAQKSERGFQVVNVNPSSASRKPGFLAIRPGKVALVSRLRQSSG